MNLSFEFETMDLGDKYELACRNVYTRTGLISSGKFKISTNILPVDKET